MHYWEVYEGYDAGSKENNYPIQLPDGEKHHSMHYEGGRPSACRA